MAISQILHLGDGLAGARGLPRHSVDLALLDPPFGTTAAAWDQAPDLRKLWEVLTHAMAPQGAVIIMAAQPFASRVVCELPERAYRHDLIWESPNGTAGGAIRNGRRIAPLKAHTHILVFTTSGAGLAVYHPQKTPGDPYNVEGTWNDRGTGDTLQHSPAHGGKRRPHTSNPTGERWPRSVLRLPHDARRGWDLAKGRHKVPGGPSTQKPQSLLRYLIRAYSDPGALVLDTYAGSGSALAAARAEGRSAIGYEKTADFHAAAISAWGLGAP